MKVCYAAAVLFLTVTLTFAGGGAAPRKEDVPKYLKMLAQSQNAKDRALAANMLGKRGAIRASDVADAVGPLQKALEKDSDGAVRAAAAKALGNIGGDPEGTVPLLIGGLKDKVNDVKFNSIVSLGQFGPDAKDALPGLREFLGKKDDKVNSQAAKTAIGNITGKKKKN